MDRPVPTLEWLHVCDNAFRDEHGKMCLIGMFDALHSVRLPGGLPVFSVAIGMTNGQGDYEVALQILSPSGGEQTVKLPPLHLTDPRAKQRAVIRLNALPFQEFGRYVFRLVIDGRPVEDPVHTLDHFQAPQPGGGPGATDPSAN